MSLVSLIGRGVKAVRTSLQIMEESLVPTLITNGSTVEAGVAFSVCPDPRSPRSSTRVEVDSNSLEQMISALDSYDPSRVRSTFDIVTSSLRQEEITDDAGEVTATVISFDYSDAKHSRKVSVPVDEFPKFLAKLREISYDLEDNADRLRADLIKVQAEEDARKAASAARKLEREAKKGLKIKV